MEKTSLEIAEEGRNPMYDLLAKYQIPHPRCGAGVGPGWLPLIETLIQELIAVGWDRDCQQIKEKFGGLRFYIGAGNDEIHAIISRYESLSYKTCEECGFPGKRTSGGWIKTLCKDCQSKEE